MPVHGDDPQEMTPAALESEGATEEVAPPARHAIRGLLTRPGLAAGMTDAIHAALTSAHYGWLVTEEGGPGEENSDYVYENPTDSGVAAQVATTAALEYLAGDRLFTREGEVPADEVAEVLRQVQYKDWSFEAVRLPDGTVGAKVIAPLRDHRQPGRLFRTSRVAPAGTRGSVQRRVLEAALRAIMSIEEHEAREELRLGPEQPLDPHVLPPPTNRRKIALGPESPRSS